jgi:hypothetical protein
MFARCLHDEAHGSEYLVRGKFLPVADEGHCTVPLGAPEVNFIGTGGLVSDGATSIFPHKSGGCEVSYDDHIRRLDRWGNGSTIENKIMGFPPMVSCAVCSDMNTEVVTEPDCSYVSFTNSHA